MHDGLHELGYVEGQNIAFDYRFAEGQAKTLDELAAQLVQLGPDVIVTVASGAALASHNDDPDRDGNSRRARGHWTRS